MSPSSSAEATASDPLRPGDHIDAPAPAPPAPGGSKLGLAGWLRFLWRQLTSMRTAIVLLLLLAVGAIPGSLVPQRSSDPNGVIQVRADNPDLVWLYDALSLHDVYSSPWFSAIYILLFTSLVGCVIPRLAHHWRAMRAQPPRTPARLSRLVGFQTVPGDASDLDRAERVLRRLGYRTVRYGESISAERGYLRETGNLLFHIAMLAMILVVGLGSGFGYNGQRLVVEGRGFANALSSYDTFSSGQWFDDAALEPFSVQLDRLDVVYETENPNAVGAPIDFTAHVSVNDRGEQSDAQIKVNEPLGVAGADLYLISNGYAPRISVRDPSGEVVYDEFTPFLAQDDLMTSLGVMKLPDGLDEQLGLRGFFYPTAVELETGALASGYPDLANPVLSLQAFTGDLGLDAGIPRSVYSLETDDMTQIAGGESGTDALVLVPGQTVDIPGGLGTITFEEVRRYGVIDVHVDHTQTPVFWIALVLLVSLLASLLVPRRRMWVKVAGGRLELAGLARGEDPTLERAVDDLAKRLREDGGDADAGADADASATADSTADSAADPAADRAAGRE
ncbi:cytochrome c biogenesis protein ResB [Agrococcus carbonis]|uniref:Cytochrome c biogenesis protein n=1 Tax=Agrococcus carbonis TaxID=684552 RepID=A0A1H1MSV4_9MICO|nr:cytochrome c biogenesis protein ResB [Agrococcus carbonis]SDR89788.1 cytochrome c biogenesis protein [Agrococcus carbonis]